MTGVVPTPAGDVPRVEAALTWRDRVGGWKVRWGIGRYSYTIDPGLYALGAPDDTAPVLVSANYKLSFDALRRELPGRDAWILALDTRGINVWCAAGKGTFGTEEVVERVTRARLPLVVSHRAIVLPQLGAPGVSSPDVRRRTGYRAVWGPVRASDLPAFLDAGMRATDEMRRVRFTVRDRLVLMPVELVGSLGIAAAVAAGAALSGGIGPGVWSLARALARAPLALATPFVAVLAGAVLAPLLLPWLRGRMFALKGAQAGMLASIALILATPASTGWPDLLAAIAFVIAGASFGAMNFTGTSTYTSLHGVEKEMRAWIPWQAALAALAGVLWIAGGWW